MSSYCEENWQPGVVTWRYRHLTVHMDTALSQAENVISQDDQTLSDGLLPVIQGYHP